MEPDKIAAGLRAWTKNHDGHVRAAVELLCWHEHWIRRADFVKACVTSDRDGTSWIRWEAARAFAFGNPRASTSELAILDLAVSLGSDRYKLSRMGNAHAEAIVRAFATATGMEGMIRG